VVCQRESCIVAPWASSGGGSLYRRLVSAGHGSTQPLAFPAAGTVLAVLFLTAVPWSLRSTDLARTYLSPQGRQAIVLCGAAAAVVIVVVGAVQLSVGFGLLASVYGRDTRRGSILATPWGVAGLRRQRLRVTDGTVTVRMIDEPPFGPVYRYGVQRVYFSQGGRTLHTVSYVRYSEDSRNRLVGWLQERGATPLFEGDERVLPAG